MSADPDWPTLLADYETAIQEFAQVSRALTAVLMDGKSSPEDVQALLAAEARTRDTVALRRMRLVNQWRSSQAELGTPPPLSEDDEQHT